MSRRRSVQKSGECERLHDAIDFARELVKRGNNRLTFDNLRFRERYCQRELRIHVHVERAFDGPNAEQFCAFFLSALLTVWSIHKRSFPPWYGLIALRISTGALRQPFITRLCWDSNASRVS